MHKRITFRGRLSLAALLPGCFIVGSLWAQLTPDHVLNRYTISDLQFSSDGHHLAMTVTEPVKGTEQRSNIWVFETKTQKLRHFTTSKKSDRSPRWSPDGQKIAYLSNRDDKTQIYLIPLQGGESVPLTNSKSGIRSFEWSGDGSQIAYLSTLPKSEDEEKKEEEKDDARVVDKDDRHAQLWIIDILTKEVLQLTQEPWRISDYVWMPKGDKLILSATDHPQPELETNRIYEMNVSSKEMTEIANPSKPYRQLKLSPDGTSLAYSGTHIDGPTAHDLCMMSLADKQTKNLTHASLDRPVGRFFWKNERELFAQVSSGFSNTFYEVSTDGSVKKQKDLPVHPMGSFSIHSNSVAFVGQTTGSAQELWILNKSGKAEKMSHFNSAWDTLTVVLPKIFTYFSSDGVEIEASLFKPPDSVQGVPLPLVVLVHGGPTGRWSDSFHSWAQLLVQRGFAVLCPNIRGSTGYGYEFMAMNRYDWGGGDFQDVMAGVDHLIEKRIADPNRLGIGGWSYGGYMAAWAVTQTDRFNASVSGAPMTDLAFEYGSETSSINAYDTWFLGTPYENLDLFINRSPTRYIKNVKTPTLILCGENDVIDPVEQCQMFYRGLKKVGVETEFVIYPREGHGIREEKHQIDLLNRMIGWFDEYVQGNR